MARIARRDPFSFPYCCRLLFILCCCTAFSCPAFSAPPWRSESTKAGSLTSFISLSRWSCWSNADCYSALLITALDNGNVVIHYTCMSIRLQHFISMDQTYWYTLHPLVSYSFIKIELTSCYLLLFVVYMRQKLLNFINAFNYYKQKMKVGPV